MPYTIALILPAVGRLCKWSPAGGRDAWADSPTFEVYRRTLSKECAEGGVGVLEWTVPLDAPDLLYYQVRLPAFKEFECFVL